MSAGIMLAMGSLVVLAALHSGLGERLLIGPLLAAPAFPKVLLPADLAKQILRFAWHLTSLAWLGLAWALALEPGTASAVSALLALSGLVTLASTRGRHFGWVVFLGGALGGWKSTLPPGALVPAAAWAGAALLAVLAALHLAWASGWRWGRSVAVPQVEGRRLFTPSPPLTLVVAGGLAALSALLLSLGGALPPLPFGRWLGAAAAAVFGARTLGDRRVVGLFKRVQGTAFARWDSQLFTPLSFGLSAAFVWVLWG